MDTIQRDLLLSEGKVVGNFWFNEKTAHSFITSVVFAQVNNLPSVNWPDKDRQWTAIPTAQAVEICKRIIAELQSIYGGQV